MSKNARHARHADRRPDDDRRQAAAIQAEAEALVAADPSLTIGDARAKAVGARLARVIAKGGRDADIARAAIGLIGRAATDPEADARAIEDAMSAARAAARRDDD